MKTDKLSCRSFIPVLLSVLLLSGCGEDALYSQLSEQDANDMVALLHASGLTASKVAQSGEQFSVTTSRASFADAVALLHANGFPRKQFDSLGEVFAKEGFVSSPLEERARLNHALSQEIARTISSIDGVVMARVHLAVPESDRLSGTRHPASASVFVKHRAGHDLTSDITQIKALVVNGVENLPYENVTLALFSADSKPVPVPLTSDRAAVAESGHRYMSLGLPVARVVPLPVAAGIGLSLAFGAGLLAALLLRRRPGLTS